MFWHIRIMSFYLFIGQRMQEIGRDGLFMGIIITITWIYIHVMVIHGHHHNHYMDIYPFINGERKTINASVELIDYNPVSFDELFLLNFDKIKRMDTIKSAAVM